MHTLTDLRLAWTWFARPRLRPGGSFSSLTSFQNGPAGYKTSLLAGLLNCKSEQNARDCRQNWQVQLDGHMLPDMVEATKPSCFHEENWPRLLLTVDHAHRCCSKSVHSVQYCRTFLTSRRLTRLAHCDLAASLAYFEG